MDDVYFSTYKHPALLHDGATIAFVGGGPQADEQGFVVEINPAGVHYALLIDAAAASYHVRCAREALLTGQTLSDRLVELSVEFETRQRDDGEGRS